MKKFIWLFMAIVIIIISFLYGFFTYKKNNNSILQENAKYEAYLNKEIYGVELASIINKAIDNNIIQKVEKDNKGKYIDNNESSIKIDIKFIDNDTIYDIETIYNGGIDNFVKYYDTIKFKLMDIKYHHETQKVKYLYFEQITN